VARGKTIAFVEVKARPTADEATEAATPAGRRRVARAAALWLSQHPREAQRDLRLDVIVAVPRRLPRHIMGAFDADGAA
jgi:putative endonuclease